MDEHKKKNIVELTRITLEEYRRARKLPLMLVVDNVRSMQNTGSLLRTCDGFAVESVLLCGITGRPPHPEIARSALGAEESVRWQYESDAVEACRRLKNEGWTLCVLEQTHGSIYLPDFRCEPCRRYAIVVGNEVEGVNQEIADMADVCLEIPQFGVKHSLNVAVSGAIALYQLAMQLQPGS